jgi:hypothetical protein
MMLPTRYHPPTLRGGTAKYYDEAVSGRPKLCCPYNQTDI